ncbi:MAG: carboxypeptidase-like regulatory domain-containing protein, partial [Bacteroidetes bacterium]|nr:carboxypeptidase-like regulatory domain-containing protein [Bacteroidota bacterium]
MSLILMSSISYSQTTGSIGGTVVDALDKSPLPGATIKIEGSNQGAVTNDNGEFVILNIDVGTYTLEASYIGYNTNRITGVKVSVDA